MRIPETIAYGQALYHVLTRGSNAASARLSVTRAQIVAISGRIRTCREPLPRVWILQSPHSGDNTQLRALAEALGLARGGEAARPTAGTRGCSACSACRRWPAWILPARARSAPPWPDLVICSGRGAEAVCLLAQAAEPEAPHRLRGHALVRASTRFDLVITTPQYRLPRAPNVLHNTLPLHDVTPERLAAEARRWEARLAAPAAALHGRSGGRQQRALSVHAGGRRAARAARRRASPRPMAARCSSPPAPAPARRRRMRSQPAIGVPHFLYRWQGPAADNPFHAFLGLSDADRGDGRFGLHAGGGLRHGQARSSSSTSRRAAYAMRAEEGGDAERLPPIGWKGRTLRGHAVPPADQPPAAALLARSAHRAPPARRQRPGAPGWATMRLPAHRRRGGGRARPRAVARIRGLFGL